MLLSSPHKQRSQARWEIAPGLPKYASAPMHAVAKRLPNHTGVAFGALGLKLTLGLCVLSVGYIAWLDLRVTTAFEGKRWAVPARIYARALAIYPGMTISETELTHELVRSGYRKVNKPSRQGEFSHYRGVFSLFTRPFSYWDASEPARRVEIRFEDKAIRSLQDQHGDVAIMRLDPALIGRILPTHKEDRVLVEVEDVPALLVDTLLAVEDRGFYRHHGISVRGIARALMANLRAGATVQGGSTITQQLAKNLFLSHERRLSRKLNEVIIALILETRYHKNEILAAYLNEIFLGQQGGRAIHGFGLASYHYFGRPIAELGGGGGRNPGGSRAWRLVLQPPPASEACPRTTQSGVVHDGGAGAARAGRGRQGQERGAGNHQKTAPGQNVPSFFYGYGASPAPA